MLVMVSALQTVISRVSWQTFVYSKNCLIKAKILPYSNPEEELFETMLLSIINLHVQ